MYVIFCRTQRPTQPLNMTRRRRRRLEATYEAGAVRTAGGEIAGGGADERRLHGRCSWRRRYSWNYKFRWFANSSFDTAEEDGREPLEPAARALPSPPAPSVISASPSAPPPAMFPLPKPCYGCVTNELRENVLLAHYVLAYCVLVLAYGVLRTLWDTRQPTTFQAINHQTAHAYYVGGIRLYQYLVYDIRLRQYPAHEVQTHLLRTC